MTARLRAARAVLRRRTGVVVLGAAGVFAAGSVAGAEIRDSGGSEIHACYQENNGYLRVVAADDGASCRPSERSLDWNRQGEPGRRGPSDAFAAFRDPEVALPTNATTMLELDVPAGRYVVTATIVTRNASENEFSKFRTACRTFLPSGDFDEASTRLAPPDERAHTQTLTMNPVGSSAGPGKIRLFCWDNGGGVQGSWMKITAIKVDNLTNTPG